MLLGMSLVAVPLLFAVINAAFQIRRLASQSEALVVQGVEATRYNQLLFEQIASLERSARLYQVIGNRELLEVYRQNHERSSSRSKSFVALQHDPRSDAQLETLRTESVAIWQLLSAATAWLTGGHAGGRQFFPPVGNGDGMLADASRHRIDQQLETLQRRDRERAKRICSGRRQRCSRRRCPDHRVHAGARRARSAIWTA